MESHDNQLAKLLHALRRRKQMMIALRGLTLYLCLCVTLLLLTGSIAYRYRHSVTAINALRATTIIILAGALYLLLVRPLIRRISDYQLARFIEERYPEAKERFITAVEMIGDDRQEAQPSSSAIVRRLLLDADYHAAQVDPDQLMRRRKLFAYAASSLICLLLFGGVLRWGPGTLHTGVAELVSPTGLAASKDALLIRVRPGSARVPKGSDQQIIATLGNFNAENVTLFARPVSADQQANAEVRWSGQTMEPAKAQSDYQFFIFNIQDSTEYFVEAKGVRSETFQLDVVELPFVKQLDLTLNFPAYTRTAAKTIEDGGEVAAVKGTSVRVVARLTGKAKSARIVLRDGRKIEMRPDGTTDFGGVVTVAGDTSYYVELTSSDGEAYRGSNDHDIVVLEDRPPTVTFEKPGRDLRASSLEEVFTQAKAEDDYGVVSMALYFSVNGEPTRKVDLQKLNRDAAQTLSGTHTFFLEEYGLKPGDFVSYYAKARDASHEATSDIYFIEVKPFDLQFKQAQQQGGEGNGGEEQNALTRRQKELIAATFRLTREEDTRRTTEEKRNNFETIAQGQERLRGDADNFVERLRRRLAGQLEGQEKFAEMVKHLNQAASEMSAALTPLKKQDGKNALPAEQRALQQLLAADSIFREMQVAMGNQSGSGGGGSRDQSQEMSQLFELELDKMKNQYETLRREQQQQSSTQGNDELQRKLEELARRQQRVLEEQQRRQQQMGGPQNSSGGGGSERQQQELADETRKAARELERLSRERRDPRLQELSRQLNQAADDMQRAQAAARSNGNENQQQEAIAQTGRALQRLEQARRRLQGSQQSGSAQEIGNLRQRASEAAARQREITKDVDALPNRRAQNGAKAEEDKKHLAERKDALAEAVNNLEQDIEQTARSLGQSNQKLGEQLREAAANSRRNQTADRIRRNQRNIENDQYGAARSGERAVQQNLNDLAERLRTTEQKAGQSAGTNGEEALDRTRALADNLESLRRRLSEQAANHNSSEGRDAQPNSASGKASSGGRRESRSDQGASSGQSEGESSGSQEGDQFGGGSSSQGNLNNSEARSSADGEGDDDRQLGGELRERLREAQDLRRQLGRDGGGATRDLDRAIERLERLAGKGGMQGAAQTAAALKAQVIEPLRQVEMELSRRFEAKNGNNNLRLGDDGTAPERYRKLVDEYYKRLSKGSLR